MEARRIARQPQGMPGLSVVLIGAWRGRWAAGRGDRGQVLQSPCPSKPRSVTRTGFFPAWREIRPGSDPCRQMCRPARLFSPARRATVGRGGKGPSIRTAEGLATAAAQGSGGQPRDCRNDGRHPRAGWCAPDQSPARTPGRPAEPGSVPLQPPQFRGGSTPAHAARSGSAAHLTTKD